MGSMFNSWAMEISRIIGEMVSAGYKCVYIMGIEMEHSQTNHNWRQRQLGVPGWRIFLRFDYSRYCQSRPCCKKGKYLTKSIKRSFSPLVYLYKNSL
jgi:hypothetical protein